MTRKHFDEIARVIRLIEGASHDEGFDLLELAVTLADSFENFDPAFDRARFLKACGHGPPFATGVPR